jgi:hypothetical protein
MSSETERLSKCLLTSSAPQSFGTPILPSPPGHRGPTFDRRNDRNCPIMSADTPCPTPRKERKVGRVPRDTSALYAASPLASGTTGSLVNAGAGMRLQLRVRTSKLGVTS